MSSDTNDWPDPEGRVVDPKFATAFGYATIMYNFLEDAMGQIFRLCSPFEKEFAHRLYRKLNNRDRVDLLSAFVEKLNYPADLQEAVQYCIRCYDICTENRNILMHAMVHDGTDVAITVSKYASRGPSKLIRFHIPLTELRAAADAIAETFVYAVKMWGFLERKVLREEVGAHESLPEKPPKPSTLTPYQPPEVHIDDPLQPRSSRA